MGSAVSAAVKSAIGRSNSTRSTSTSNTSTRNSATRSTGGGSSGRASYGSSGSAFTPVNPSLGGPTSLRTYLSNNGQAAPGYDPSTGTTYLNGNAYKNGTIPGTQYDATTGTHYVVDPTQLNSALNGRGETVPQQQTPEPQPNIYQPHEDIDTTEYVNQLRDAQRRSRISALDKAKSTALSALDTEKAAVAPTYYDKRNAAAANSEVGAMNFAQFMAARGIKGAAGAMPEIYRNAGLQGQIGALDRQEASELGAIERQRANIESGYASDVAAADADVEAQAMQSMIDQYNANRTYALQQAASKLEQDKYDWSKSSSNPAYRAQELANKKAELENTAAAIANSYLPDTYKQQAELLKQKVLAGSLDYDTALAQLNQIKAQTANYLHSANAPYKTSGSGGKQSTSINQQYTQQVIAELLKHNTTGRENLFNQYASYWAQNGVDVAKVQSAVGLSE